MRILAAAESHSTEVLYYLPSRTDGGSTSKDGMLNMQTDGRRLWDDRVTKDGTNDEGQMTGRIRNRQMVESKKIAHWSINR